MTGKQFADLIRLRTRTNSSTLTDSDIVILANSVKDDLAQKVVHEDESVFNIPMTGDLAENLDGTPQREYPLPSTILGRIISVEAKLDGTNFVPLLPMPINEYTKADDEDTIIDYFSNTEGSAKYVITRNSIKIYSGDFSAVTGGLKIVVNAYPEDIDTDTLADTTNDLGIDPSTTTFSLPREVHNVWADGVIIDWKSSREKPIPLTAKEQLWESRAWRAVLDSLHGKVSFAIVAETPNSSKEWNNGFNL